MSVDDHNLTVGSSFDPDRPLWERVRNGDEKAFDDLRLKYSSLVKGAIRKNRPTVSDADLDDLDQDIWLGVWKSLLTFQGKSKFSTWLYRVATNHLLGIVRKQGSETRKIDALIADMSHDEVHSEETSILDRLEIEKCVKILTIDEWRVIHYRHVMQLTDEEIATTTQIPLGTVKLRIRTGHKKLRIDIESDN